MNRVWQATASLTLCFGLIACTSTPTEDITEQNRYPHTAPEQLESQQAEHIESDSKMVTSDSNRSVPEVDIEVVLPKSIAGKVILGRKEWVYLPSIGTSVEAVVDDKLIISTLSISEMTSFARDGKDWVKFNIIDNRSHQTALPIQRWISLDDSAEKKPTVVTWIDIGGVKEKVEFALLENSDAKALMQLNPASVKYVAKIDLAREFVQAKR
jgi:hypothetical protein